MMTQPDQPQFFEGVEKKVELVVERGRPGLRSFGDRFWAEVAEASGAGVLSKIANDRCDAFLLSESSMFVFDRKLVMITCGRTRPPLAVEKIIERVPSGAIEMFIYERKNEVYPHDQPTSFFDDVRVLNDMFSGRAFRFGEEDEHHVLLFHQDRPYTGDGSDVTVELLMHGIADPTRDLFNAPRVRRASDIRDELGLDRLMPGFLLDDWLFEPSGYSINALRGEHYWTLHVTPERDGSYASFESNVPPDGDFDSMFDRLLGIFRPRSFDLIVFDQGTGPMLEPLRYRLRSHVARELTCGYQVRFQSFYRPRPEPLSPRELPLG